MWDGIKKFVRLVEAIKIHIPLQSFFGKIRRASMHYLNPDYRKAADT